MSEKIAVPDEIIVNRIFLIRDQKVMLDRDLAELYGVETKRLKEQVRRNINRFPESFMFKLTRTEYTTLRSQFATLKKGVQKKRGVHSKYLPFAFSEYGILMLSSVLNNDAAIKISIHIIETFVQLRKLANNYEEIIIKIENMDFKYKVQFGKIYEVLQRLMEKPKEKPRQKIGYKK